MEELHQRYLTRFVAAYFHGYPGRSESTGRLDLGSCNFFKKKLLFAQEKLY